MIIREKVIKVITEMFYSTMDKQEIESYFDENDDLLKLGMNSIIFIKIVVKLESEFAFEFEDEDLDYNNFKSLHVLCEYVEKNIMKPDVVTQ